MMSKWNKLPAVQPKPNPCLHCPDPLPELRMDKRIAVGFGSAALTMDGRHIWSEGPNMEYEDCMTVEEAEKKANLAPNHDWRIELHGPLHGETYQRQGKGKWVCIETNQGFA